MSWARLARRLSAMLSVIIIVIPGPEEPAAPDGTAGSGGASTPESAAPTTTAEREPNQAETGQGGSSEYQPVPLIPGRGETVRVTDAASLAQALAEAKPGQTIELADGTYHGKFVINTVGEEGNPITLKGSRNAILTGGEPGSGSGYDLHLDGADYWQLVGFTVTGLEKGIMTDRTNHTVLSDLSVGNTGAEAVHFGNFSSNNVIQNSEIHDTGKSKPQFGEGVYFGTAKSNWGKKSGGQPDRSNNNKAINNTFRSITAENIDAKEETSGGVIAGNRFDGSAISGKNFADSVVDIKGVNYQVVNNITTGSSSNLRDGFQTHVITSPETSGCGNTFANNVFDGVRFNGGQEIAVDKKCGADSADSGSSGDSRVSESKGQEGT